MLRKVWATGHLNTALQTELAMLLDARAREIKELRGAHEPTADVMLAQLCAKSRTGVHVRKPDGVCVHCGTQANELSEDFLRAATLVNDGHGYTVWRIGGQQFVPLDEANEAVRIARESSVNRTEKPE